jgi:hypothetical protein
MREDDQVEVVVDVAVVAAGTRADRKNRVITGTA